MNTISKNSIIKLTKSIFLFKIKNIFHLGKRL